MIGWPLELLVGALWPPTTPPAPVRPAWLPKGDPTGRPCPECGVRMVDGECVACLDGWIVA